MTTLKQICEKKIIDGGMILDPDDYIQCVREWLQQKETDDFGGEMTATEFKKELLEDLEEKKQQ